MDDATDKEARIMSTEQSSAHTQAESRMWPNWANPLHLIRTIFHNGTPQLGLDSLPNVVAGQMKKIFPGPFNDERHIVGISLSIVDLKTNKSVNLNVLPILNLLEKFILRRNKCKVQVMGLQPVLHDKEVDVVLPTLYTAQIRIKLELNLSTEENSAADSLIAPRVVLDNKGNFATTWLDAVSKPRVSHEQEIDLKLGRMNLGDLEVLREVYEVIREILNLQAYSRLVRITFRCFKNPEDDGIRKYEDVQILKGTTAMNPNNNVTEHDLIGLLLSLYDSFQDNRITKVPLRWVDGMTVDTQRFRDKDEAVVSDLVMRKVLARRNAGQLQFEMPDTSNAKNLIEEFGDVVLIGANGRAVEAGQTDPLATLQEKRVAGMRFTKQIAANIPDEGESSS